MTAQLEALKQQQEQLATQIEAEELLIDIYRELGPYTSHLTMELRRRLRDHVNPSFDDSE